MRTRLIFHVGHNFSVSGFYAKGRTLHEPDTICRRSLFWKVSAGVEGISKRLESAPINGKRLLAFR